MAMTAFSVGNPLSEIAGQEIDPFWGYVQFTAIINATGVHDSPYYPFIGSTPMR